MRRSGRRLWLYFALIVFAIMCATAVIISVLAAGLYHWGWLSLNRGHTLTPFIFLLFISVVIGTVISLFVAQKILRPITKLSQAAAEVARGNFAIRLNESERVAEIRELTHNFNVMARELAGIETLRNDFVVNVSHEFKTPIAAIEGYAMLLQDNGLSAAERGEYTRIIIESSQQLAALSNNILRLSKLENQEVILEKEQFRLDEQIRQAVLLLEPEWSRKELELEIELAKIIYCGSKELLWQVWTNIMGNAVKFTSQGGKIDVRLWCEGGSVKVRISDTGSGMSDRVKRHVFDKFYQGDAARKSDGNGLGLALVKRIVQLCGGAVWVESEEGRGSVFMVTLPDDDKKTRGTGLSL